MKTQLQQVKPGDIERRSFEIIAEELSAMGRVLPPDQAPVIMRAIHASADFDYAENLYFSPGALETGLQALREGASIVTDTNMAFSGLSKPALAKLGGRALCFMADQDVATGGDPGGGLHGKGGGAERAADCGDWQRAYCVGSAVRIDRRGPHGSPTGDRRAGGLCQRGGKQRDVDAIQCALYCSSGSQRRQQHRRRLVQRPALSGRRPVALRRFAPGFLGFQAPLTLPFAAKSRRTGGYIYENQRRLCHKLQQLLGKSA